MFRFDGKGGPTPRCAFTTSSLPKFVDHEHVSTKKRPFSTILNHGVVHSLEIILSPGAAKDLLDVMSKTDPQQKYARVYMKPSQLLEGDFFNQYIKTGNIIMLSEGRPGVDQRMTLIDGILRVEVDKATFERMGLKGNPVPTTGRKHVMARYSIEINLRQSSMLHGKKGFERIVWAFENVLNESTTWIFCDLKAPTDGSGPIAGHAPIVKHTEVQVSDISDVVVPYFPQTFGQDDQETASQLLEWLAMVAVHSPRILVNDTIDAYISKYTIPVFTNKPGARSSSVQDLVRLRWHSMLSSKRVLHTYLAALKASGTGWFVLRASDFEGSMYTILQDHKHTMTWEYTE